MQSHPLFESDRHDGLWLLRYLLSHKLHVGTAAKAARKALQTRYEQRLDEIAVFVRSRPLREWPHFNEIRPLHDD